MPTNRQLTIIARVKDEVTKRMKGISGSLIRFGTFFGKHWKGITAGIIASVIAVKKVWEQFKLSQKIEQQKDAFSNLSKSFQVDSKEMVKALRAASGATITTMDLMTKASTAMALGIDPSRLSELMRVARASARAMGEDVGTMFNDIVKGIGRQSRMILDNLGIIVNSNDAYRTYAKTLGITVGEMTDLQKKQAFMNATLAAGEIIIKRVNLVGRSQAENIQAIEAALIDAKNELLAFMTASANLGETADAFIFFARGLEDIRLGGPISKMRELMAEIEAGPSKFQLFMQAIDRTFGLPVIDNMDKLREELEQIVMTLIKMDVIVDPDVFNFLDDAAVKRLKDYEEALSKIHLKAVVIKAFEPADFEFFDDAQIERMRMMQTEIIKTNEWLEKTKVKVSEISKVMIDGIKNAVSGMTNLLGDFFYNFLTGAFSDMASAFSNFGSFMLRIMVQIIAKMLMIWAVGKLIGMFSDAGFTGISDLLSKAVPEAAPSLLIGTSSVKDRGLHMLEQGEKVTSKNAADNDGGGGDTYIVANTFTFMHPEDMQRHSQALESIIDRSINRNSPLRKSIIRLT